MLSTFPLQLKSRLPAPGKDSLVMVCGPPGLMASVSGNKAPDYSQGEVVGGQRRGGGGMEVDSGLLAGGDGG